MRKKLSTLAILIIGVSLIVNLSRDIFRLLKAGDQVRKAEEKLEEQEKEHQELVEKESYFQSPEFIEEEARNKLNMAREEETIVILPPNVEEMSQWMKQEGKKEEDLPNWQRWWKLFF
jgi:cell division protein FtsB